jgi:serine/threonine-protein phosphatase 2A regulatory subunit B
MQAVTSTTNTENKWKFAQCFGDKGDSDDITEGKRKKKKLLCT